ncbi:MAG: thermonuclease family protein [Candidatus Aenigmarchaeota archaeon]|nr:thermonuclease family protein [Candidatus Aenigmarchaeota archaeon]
MEVKMRRIVKRVVDGDTLEVNRNINGTRFVRLANVNAPERHQFGGRTATKTLTGLVGGRSITLTPVARDVYGRVVAEVRCGRQSINRKMKKRGY